MDFYEQLNQQIAEQKRRQKLIEELDGMSIEELKLAILRLQEQIQTLAETIDRLKQGKTHADVQLPRLDGGGDR